MKKRIEGEIVKKSPYTKVITIYFPKKKLEVEYSAEDIWSILKKDKVKTGDHICFKYDSENKRRMMETIVWVTKYY